MFFDTHLHTSGFSFDGKMSIEELMIKQKESNIGFVITEHIDYDYLGPEKIEFNVDEYFNKYNKFRSDSLLLGIELGMQPSCFKRNEELVKEYPFDMVLASTHFPNGFNLQSFDVFSKGKTKEEAYDVYFNAIFENIQLFKCFDSMGHIDFIVRYAQYDNPEIEYEKHSEIIDEIFKCLIQNRKVLEINSKRLDNEESIKNMCQIYNRYKELNGKYVTIGSDAHMIKEVSRNFENVKKILDKCNLTPVYFKNRKMYEC